MPLFMGSSSVTPGVASLYLRKKGRQGTRGRYSRRPHGFVVDVTTFRRPALSRLGGGQIDGAFGLMFERNGSTGGGGLIDGEDDLDGAAAFAAIDQRGASGADGLDEVGELAGVADVGDGGRVVGPARGADLL